MWQGLARAQHPRVWLSMMTHYHYSIMIYCCETHYYCSIMTYCCETHYYCSIMTYCCETH